MAKPRKCTTNLDLGKLLFIIDQGQVAVFYKENGKKENSFLGIFPKQDFRKLANWSDHVLAEVLK